MGLYDGWASIAAQIFESKRKPNEIGFRNVRNGRRLIE
jgi:hypothetical protein